MEEDDGRTVSPVINRKGDAIRFYCSQSASPTEPPHYALSDLRHSENCDAWGAVVSREVDHVLLADLNAPDAVPASSLVDCIGGPGSRVDRHGRPPE